MAEVWTDLLIYMRNDLKAGNELGPQWPLRGDVIEVRAAGGVWGGEELSLPDFRIIRVPGEPSQYAHLLGPQLATATDDQGPWLARINYIDIDHQDLPAELKAHIAERTVGIHEAMPDFEVLRWKSRREPLVK